MALPDVSVSVDKQIAATESSLSFWVNQIGLLPQGQLSEAAKQAAFNAQLSLEHLRALKKLLES